MFLSAVRGVPSLTLVVLSRSPTGLEEQLLGALILEELPEVAAKKNALVISNARMTKELHDIENKILQLLSEAEGNILGAWCPVGWVIGGAVWLVIAGWFLLVLTFCALFSLLASLSLFPLSFLSLSSLSLSSLSLPSLFPLSSPPPPLSRRLQTMWTSSMRWTKQKKRGTTSK